MNKKQFERGSKRKCASCQTLFYDLGKFPIICPNCGASVALQTNVTKRGRPPKVQKSGNQEIIKEEEKNLIPMKANDKTPELDSSSTINPEEIDNELLSDGIDENIGLDDQAILDDEIPIDEEIENDSANVDNIIEVDKENKEN